MTEKLRDAARRTIALVEPRMVPADGKWTTGAIAALLMHFYTAALPAEVYDAIRRDWLACLADFPAWAIDQARIEWLKTGKRKPLPSDIVSLCNKAVGKDRAPLLLCRAIGMAEVQPPEIVLTEEERQRNSAEIGEIVKNVTRRLRSEDNLSADASELQGHEGKVQDDRE